MFGGGDADEDVLETDLRETELSLKAVAGGAALVDVCESTFEGTSGVSDLRAADVKLYSGILLRAALP